MYSDLKPLIKSAMKRQGITYKKLGAKIGMTESGIKKLFQSDDCSLSRLEKIARILDTDIASLILQVQDQTNNTEEVEISLKVQTFLQKNPQLMSTYWLLFIEELTPADIIEKFKITKARLYRSLAELDRIGCIKWKEGDRVVATKIRPFLVKSQGPLVQQWIKQFADSVISDVMTRKENKELQDVFIAQRYFCLTKESLADLRKRLEEVNIEFSAISTREKRLGKTRTKGVRLQTAFSTGSMVRNVF